MSGEQIKMTGGELKRIKERAGIQESEIEARLGIKPATYYNYTKEKNKEKPIPLDVEDRIDLDDELREIKNRELAGPKPDQMQVILTTVKAYGDLAGSIQATLNVVTALLQKQDSKYDQLARNNDFVLDMLETAKKSGEFVYRKKTA